MSKNDTIRKSDKKFIRLEKARIRRQFFDLKKRQEMINELYKRFIKTDAQPVITKAEQPKKVEKPIGRSLKAKPTGEAKAKPKKVVAKK